MLNFEMKINFFYSYLKAHYTYKVDVLDSCSDSENEDDIENTKEFDAYEGSFF